MTASLRSCGFFLLVWVWSWTGESGVALVVTLFADSSRVKGGGQVGQSGGVEAESPGTQIFASLKRFDGSTQWPASWPLMWMSSTIA